MLSHSRCSLHVYLISKYRNFLDWEFVFLSSKLYLFYDLLIFLSNRHRWDKNYQKKYCIRMFILDLITIYSKWVQLMCFPKMWECKPFLLHNVHLYKRQIFYIYLCKYMHFRRVAFHFTLVLNKTDLKVKR